MSYQNAVAYARERIQGRAATGKAQPEKAADPILVHGDVRRMLMNMKALNEAGRAFSTYVAMQLDIAKFSQDSEEKQKATGLVALLTPVAKAFLTDAGLENCIAGQQVFGGHGYIREWGQEQLVRDVRITQIYEGTNGIQALDLLGRKTVLNNGAFLNLLSDDIRRFIAEEPSDEFSEPLQKTLEELEGLTQSLLNQAADDVNVINSSAMEYLHAFSYLAYAWMWAKMARIARVKLESNTSEASFYKAKIVTARYFYKRLLPRMSSLAEAAASGANELFELEDVQF